MHAGVILFEDFDTLSAFGPLEILGNLNNVYTIQFYSMAGGLVRNANGIYVQTEKIAHLSNGLDVMIIPGGAAVKKEINNKPLIEAIGRLASESHYVLGMCTGSTLLARSGLLNNRKATSNKSMFNWVKATCRDVEWIGHARWIVDAPFYTSSGVSAALDMTLAFVRDMHGIEVARDVAWRMEYSWIESWMEDPFSGEAY